MDDAGVRARLRAGAEAPDGVLARRQRDGYEIVVVKQGRELRLYFAEPRDGALAYTGVMSRIDVTRPLKLLGAYTQAMLLTLLWAHAPHRIYAAGFGGGRLPMVLHHVFPHAEIDGAEIDGAVIALAEQYFGIVRDVRMRIAAEDAASFLQTCRAEPAYDIILIDCYSGAAAQPDKFATRDFYDLCKARLTTGGVVATNLDLNDPALREKTKTFAAAFAHAACFNDGTANVLFGAEAPAPMGRVDQLARLLRGVAPIRSLAARLKPLRA